MFSPLSSTGLRASVVPLFSQAVCRRSSFLPECTDEPARYGVVHVRNQGRIVNQERSYHVVHEDVDRLERLHQDIRSDMSHTDRAVVTNAMDLVNVHNGRAIDTNEQLSNALMRHSPLMVAYRVREGHPAPTKRALSVQPPLEKVAVERNTPVENMTPEKRRAAVADALKTAVCMQLAAKAACLPSVKKGFPLEHGSDAYGHVHAFARSIMAEQRDALRELGSLEPSQLGDQMSKDLANSVCTTSPHMLARSPEAAIRAELGRSPVWSLYPEAIAREHAALETQPVGGDECDSDWSSCDDEPEWRTTRAPKLALNVNFFVSGKDMVPLLATPAAPTATPTEKCDPLAAAGFKPYSAADYTVTMTGDEPEPAAAVSAEFTPYPAATQSVGTEEWSWEPYKGIKVTQGDFEPVADAWKFIPYGKKKAAPPRATRDATVPVETADDAEQLLRDAKAARATRAAHPRNRDATVPIETVEDVEKLLRDAKAARAARARRRVQEEFVVAEHEDDFASTHSVLDRIPTDDFSPVMLSGPEEDLELLKRMDNAARNEFVAADEEEFVPVGAQGDEEFDLVHEQPAPVGKWLWSRKSVPNYTGAETSGRLVVYNRRSSAIDVVVDRDVATEVPSMGKAEVWLKPGDRDIAYREKGVAGNLHSKKLFVQPNARYSVVIGLPFSIAPMHVRVPWMSAGTVPKSAVVRAELSEGYTASLVDTVTGAETALVRDEYRAITPGIKKVRMQRAGVSADMPKQVLIAPSQASLLVASETSPGTLRWNMTTEADASDDLYEQHEALRKQTMPSGMLFVNAETGATSVAETQGNFHAADGKECELRDTTGQAFIFDANRTMRFDDTLTSSPMAVRAVLAHPHQPRMTVVVMAPTK